MKRAMSSRRLCAGAALAMSWFLIPLHGEVVRDGTVGPAGGALAAPYDIPAALGEKRGGNLFHSFSRFNIETGQSATFHGPADVQNILARVTGGSASSIDGRLASTITGANLFLINPAGILFGPNATLDISGSFFATTADYLRLGPDGRFDATNPANTILSIAPPSAFGFSTPNPAAIRVNGSTLSGPGLKTLGLIGGDVAVSGSALLRADDVQLVSVRSIGESALSLPASGEPGRPGIASENFPVHGAISLIGPALDPAIAAAPATIQSARVVIRGGTFVMKNASIETRTMAPGDGVRVKVEGHLSLTEHSFIDASNFADMGDAKAVEISAGSMLVDELSQISTQTGPDGAGGDAVIDVRGSLRFANSAGFVSESFSLLRGGSLSLSADSIALESGASIFAHSNDIGKAGDIRLAATGRLSLTGGSRITVQPQPLDETLPTMGGERIEGTAGEIFLSSNSGFSFLDTSAQGLGGIIQLRATGSLVVEKGGFISAQTLGRDGAMVSIEAASALISGAGASNMQETGITAKSVGGPGTHGGEIRLTLSGTLQVVDGGTISTDAFGGGNGGSIDIRARDVTVTGRGGAAAELAGNPHGITARNRSNAPDGMSGPGGNVHLSLSGHLEVREAGEIIVDTIGPGAGGSVVINAGSAHIASLGTVAARTLAQENGGPGGSLSLSVSDTLSIESGGLISASTLGSGAAGSIFLRAGRMQVSGAGARVTAVSGAPGILASGRGGDITVDAGRLTLSDDGQITASTFGAGAGGSVRVATGDLLITDDSGADFAGIGAQTLGLGTGGAVEVNARSIDLRGHRAEITTESLGPGSGGRIGIRTETLSLSNGSAIQSASTGAGPAGSIHIAASGEISLRGGSALSVSAEQSSAGDLTVRSGASLFLTDSSITARAATDGGSIDLRARDLLFLTDSRISAAAGGNGGNIFIDPTLVILADSFISANAVRGRGGNVRIISDFFLAPFGSAVTATSELGIDGTVRIDALNDDLNGSLVELPSVLLNAESLLQELCSMKIENFSSFIPEGRGGLPPLPGEPLPSLQIVR